MASAPRGSYSTDRRSSVGFVAFLFGILFTLFVLVAGGWVYFKYGHPPVAVADKPFPMEAQIVHIPLDARINSEVEQPPFGTSEEVYESGAKIYMASCAMCHGTPGHESTIGKWEYPNAPQLFKKHSHGNVVGVSDDEPGETYWKVKNGIRLTGMPSYEHVYTTAQMWQVSLLMKNADQTLPEPVKAILAGSAAAQIVPTLGTVTQ